MKKHSFLWLIFAAMFAFAACSNDDPAKEPDDEDDEPEITLALPTQLQVSSFTHNSAILVWQRGDTNALAYDVYVEGLQDTIPVIDAGGIDITCGIDGLLHSTPYDWYARARRGDLKTTWVKGPSFTTAFYDDTRDHWVGTWQGATWDGSVTIFGMNLPYSQFSDYISEDVDLDAMFQSMEITITLADDNQVAMTFPQFPDGSPFPGGEILLPIIGGTATYEQEISIPIKIITEDNPVPIADIPFVPDAIKDALKNNPLLPASLSITDFSIHLKKITFTFGPRSEDNTLPARLTISGDADIATDSDSANMALNLLIPAADHKISINFTSTLNKKQE
jgi:hypothetical protein